MIVVTGLGRCGSSLAMQMLNAAGVTCAGSAPYFEVKQASVKGFDPEWLTLQKGAVKILGVHMCDLPRDDYKFIYVYRDNNQQAISQRKFSNMVLNTPAKKNVLRSNIRKESGKLINFIKARGDFLSLKFEDFFDHPPLNISKIIEFLSLEDQIEDIAPKMYSVIISRPPEAREDMRVEEVLGDKRG